MSVFISDLKGRFHRKKHVFGSIVGVPRIEYEDELAEEFVLDRDNKKKTWSVCFHLSHQESLIDYLTNVRTSLTRECQHIADLNADLCQDIADPIQVSLNLVISFGQSPKGGLRWRNKFVKMPLTAT